jgi:hypothetical protein
MSQVFFIEKVNLYFDGVTMSDSLDKSFRFTLIIIFLDYRINQDLLRKKFTFMEPAITASHAYNSANVLSERFMIYLALSLLAILIKTYFN